MKKYKYIIALLILILLGFVIYKVFYISNTNPNSLSSTNDNIPYFTGVNGISYTVDIGPNGKRGLVRSETDGSLKKMYSDNIRYLEIVVRGTLSSGSSSNISIDPNGLSDDDLVYLIKSAKSNGITPIIKPQLFINGSANTRGEIGTNWDKETTDNWFNGYWQYLKQYVDISQNEKLPFLVIATELPNIIYDSGSTNNNYEKHWRDLIKNVRDNYSGKITYAANSESISNIKWWDAVDYIGVDAYFTISDKDNPSLEDIKSGWIDNSLFRTKKAFNTNSNVNIVDSLGALSIKWNKPIVFTEVGYRSSTGADSNIVNLDYKWLKKTINQELQANLYKGLFDSFRNKSWFKGIFAWSWYIGEIDVNDLSYQHMHEIQGKSAEEVIKNEYQLHIN